MRVGKSHIQYGVRAGVGGLALATALCLAGGWRAESEEAAPNASLWENYNRFALLSQLNRYNRWLVDRVSPFIRGEVCEGGCGTGNLCQGLLHHRLIVGLEPVPP